MSLAEQPRWLQALAAALQEALPRLHGCAAEPLLGELIAALTAALADGELEMAVPSAAHRQALLASPLAADPDGPLVLVGDRLCWRRWQRQRQAVLEAAGGRVETLDGSPLRYGKLGFDNPHFVASGRA